MLVSWKVSLVYVGVVSVILQSKDSYSIKLVPLEFKHFSIRVVGSVERVPAELEEEEGKYMEVWTFWKSNKLYNKYFSVKERGRMDFQKFR